MPMLLHCMPPREASWYLTSCAYVYISLPLHVDAGLSVDLLPCLTLPSPMKLQLLLPCHRATAVGIFNACACWAKPGLFD